MGRDLKILINNPFFSDVVFLFPETEAKFYAHNVILKARGFNYPGLMKIEQEFKNFGLPTQAPIEIGITNISYSVFAKLMEYLYTGCIEQITEDILRMIFMVASEYELNALMNYCSRRLKSMAVIEHEEDVDTLAKSMRKFFNNPIFSDIKFQEGNMVLWAHRAILFSRSAHFKGLLESGMKEPIEGIIKIKDVSYGALKGIVEFLYTGNHITIYTEYVMDLLMASNLFVLDQLTKLCESHIKQAIDADNVISIYHACINYGALQLKSFCLHYMTIHYAEVSTKKDFHKLDLQIREDLKKMRWPPIQPHQHRQLIPFPRPRTKSALV